MHGRRVALVSLAAVFTLSAVPAASADHHFVSVSEVYPGTTANPSDEFIELQMYADGQTLFSGMNDADIDVYTIASSTVLDFDIPTDPPFGISQRTVLLGTATADAEFSVTSDYVMPAAGNYINPAGGAVCFSSVVEGNIDCVSWGGFMNIGSLPVGTTPAASAGITNTQSIQRSLAPGCPTLLEAGDDSNPPNSAGDFNPGAPTPRANTTPATETECSPPIDTPTGNTPTTNITTPTGGPAATNKPVAKKCKKAKKKDKKGAATAACKKKKKKK